MIIRPYHASRAQSRGVNTVQGIVLHEINESAAFIDGRMQSPLTHTGLAHQGFHFLVDAAQARAYVPVSSATFAIADTDTMSPWSIAAANPGIEADLYTVNVAVVIGVSPLPNPCEPECARVYPPQLLSNLQRLLNQIGELTSLDITEEDVVWRHGAELCDLDIAPLLEPVEDPDPGQVDWLCDRLAELPEGTSETPMLVGSDCALYPLPAGGAFIYDGANIVLDSAVNQYGNLHFTLQLTLGGVPIAGTAHAFVWVDKGGVPFVSGIYAFPSVSFGTFTNDRIALLVYSGSSFGQIESPTPGTYRVVVSLPNGGVAFSNAVTI